MKRQFDPSAERIYAEINLDALERNYLKLKKQAENKSLLFMVKADAYGHGLKAISKFLSNKADFFGVASVQEGIVLRRTVEKTPILNLGKTWQEEFKLLLRHNITPAVFDYSSARALNAFFRREKCNHSIHIAIDSGMSRLGMLWNDYSSVNRLSELKNLKIDGAYSHFSCADTDWQFTAVQQQRSLLFIKHVEEVYGGIRYRHIANSLGCFLELDNAWNLTRPGILLYGLPVKGIREFEPILSLKTRIIQVKTIPKGSGVSYGGRYVCERDTRVAVLSAGYGDGYHRNLSEHTSVLLEGRRCPVIGRICMDFMMLDVSELPDVQVGAEAVLIGRQGNEEITAEELALSAETIHYEITTGLSARVPRYYLRQGERVGKYCPFIGCCDIENIPIL